MSRVGNYPIDVPKGVEVTLDAAQLRVKGSKGSLSVAVDEAVEIKREEDRLRFTARRDDQHAQAMAGTLRALVNNMLKGVSQGFSKKLELQGVGYRASLKGTDLELAVGYSHTVTITPRTGVSFEVPIPTQIIVKGTDKQVVGQTAAEIRKVRPPEPYKGKGIRYRDEQVRRKVGKRA